MVFPKKVLLLMMLFILSFFMPRVSAQIPEVPPPTRDEQGTIDAWKADVHYQNWLKQQEAKKRRDAEAQRKREETRQRRLEKAQEAAKEKADAKIKADAKKQKQQQARAEEQRQKEEKRREEKRKEAMEAERRQKDKERKANALDMLRRFQKATAGVDLAVSENTNVDEVIYKQNNLFVGVLNHDAISSEETQKYRLNLPILNETSTSVVRLDTIPPPPPLMQGGLMPEPPVNGDRPQTHDINFDMPGLDHVSQWMAEVTDTLQSEAISELEDFIIGSIQNPRATIALKGGKIYSDFTSDVLTNTLENIDNAVDFLATQQKQSQNFVIHREDQR